ncbi:MAG: TlpA family protein disulfide reductase [Deltaproteobacteria bacterium]|nr:TlpA family protein disulfide reductase [Deltaproteobacteria bacterium]
MKKSTIIIGLLLFGLLISFGVIAVVVFGNDHLAKTDSGSNNLDWLMADIGVSPHPFSNDPLEAKLLSTAGRSVGLDDFRGKIVFLNFWTTWCPTCITEMPSMEKLHRKLLGKNFAMVTVNIRESASQVKNFFEKYKLTFTALLDTTGEVSTDFGIRAIPTTFILDKSGQIIGRIAGPREWDSRKSVALFENLAANL